MRHPVVCLSTARRRWVPPGPRVRTPLPPLFVRIGTGPRPGSVRAFDFATDADNTRFRNLTAEAGHVLR